MEAQVTQLLSAWNDGDEAARDRLIPVVYDELRRLAGGFLNRERANHTLQPTARPREAGQPRRRTAGAGSSCSSLPTSSCCTEDLDSGCIP